MSYFKIIILIILISRNILPADISGPKNLPKNPKLHFTFRQKESYQVICEAIESLPIDVIEIIARYKYCECEDAFRALQERFANIKDQKLSRLVELFANLIDFTKCIQKNKILLKRYIIDVLKMLIELDLRAKFSKQIENIDQFILNTYGDFSYLSQESFPRLKKQLKRLIRIIEENPQVELYFSDF